MFTIIGGDGKEYGPATADQIRAWIAAGRANLDTQAKASGSAEWRRLGDHAAFAPPGTTPPALPQSNEEANESAPEVTLEVIAPELASRGARTGAAIVNALYYLMSILPGSIAMSRKMIEENPDMVRGVIPSLEDINLTALAEGMMWVWTGLLSAICLQCILLAFRGQNLGKVLFGGRIVRADNGEPAGWLRAGVLRFLLPVGIIMMLNVAFPLGFLFLAIDYTFMFRYDQRCLHDLIAGTKVVRS